MERITGFEPVPTAWKAVMLTITPYPQMKVALYR